MIDTTAPGRPTSPAAPRRGAVSTGTPGIDSGSFAARAVASVTPTASAVAA
ncbi:hypothetical protein [Agromyces bracchium]|uniref:Uncharacterized protein n=1 Tax=Agromyces bracchium TaxID=88376 RepID=A0A6I3M2L0_9MICO|nr:hypothetical protein [Agromyces bracchium]MTH67138.1 hypothetical protein [Agromyces bracchium]